VFGKAGEEAVSSDRCIEFQFGLSSTGQNGLCWFYFVGEQVELGKRYILFPMKLFDLEEDEPLAG
jgi:hypothetical protein